MAAQGGSARSARMVQSAGRLRAASTGRDPSASPSPPDTAVCLVEARAVPGIGGALRLLLSATHPRLAVAQAVSHLLPPFVGSRVFRVRLYRWAGLHIDPDAGIAGELRLTSSLPGFYTKLRVDFGAKIGHCVSINLDDTVVIGRGVSISPHVQIYTGSHRIGPASARMSRHFESAPVTIEDGAWIRAGALILPGVTVGKGSIVGAGAVVSRDVPANTYVEGNPARVVRRLPWADR